MSNKHFVGETVTVGITMSSLELLQCCHAMEMMGTKFGVLTES